jgi:disulfide oxidoreductase YuzD
MKKKSKIKWLKKPQMHNYPTAYSYLGLIYNGPACVDLVKKLKAASITAFKSKDIFRAADISLLGISNSHVEQDRKKIKKGIAISPILLVRDTVNGKVIIADGYHRLCAVYSFDEDAVIPCKIV